MAAIAAGADGLIIEVHDNPENAMSDGVQSLLPVKFDALVEKGRKIAKVMGRSILKFNIQNRSYVIISCITPVFHYFSSVNCPGNLVYLDYV